MVHIPKKGLGNLLSESANTFGGFAVVVEKRPSFSVKCLLRRQSTRCCEQHSAIPLIKTGAFESSCKGFPRYILDLFNDGRTRYLFCKVPENRVTSARTILPHDGVVGKT